jgi:long-chain fatty acid transport protein
LELAVLAAAWAMSAQADGFRNPPPDAAGLARGGASVAQAEDASAVYYNPANLAGQERSSAVVAASFARTETEYRAGPASATSESEWQVLPSVFACFPLAKAGSTAGLGISTPFGQSSEWPEQSVFRYSAPYFAEMQLVNVNPAVAWPLSEKLRVGAGLDLYVSSLEFRQFYPWAMASGAAGLPDGVARFEADGTGLGANLGLSWDVAPSHRLALAYRSAVKVDYEGDFRLSGMPPPAQAAGFRPSSDFSTEIEFPNLVAAAWGVRVSDRVRVEADVEWVNWSSYEELELDVGRNAALLPADAIRADWEDTWTFAIGADWAFRPGWTARAGYAYLESPVPDETFSPSLPDANRHVVSLGLGYARGDHRVDLAVAFSAYEDREISGQPNPTLNGEYEIASDLVGLSYHLAF